MANACVFLMKLSDDRLNALISREKNSSTTAGSEKSNESYGCMPPLINIGMGKDLTIRELSEMIRDVVGYKGEITFDSRKPDGTPRKILDISVLESLDWKAQIELSEGLREVYAQYLEH